MQREGGLRATRAREKGAVCLHVMIGQGTFFLMLASMTTVVVGSMLASMDQAHARPMLASMEPYRSCSWP